MDDLPALMAASPLAWINFNKLVNENQRLLEFNSHRFMIEIYADNHPDICCIKSAQVGFSVYAILKAFHELIHEHRNVIYALPTHNVVSDFVTPKVNPLIDSNPPIAAHVGSDSVSLKKVGKRFIYFKGGSEREAISVSADTLVIDELDKMPDMGIVTMFDSRLQAAESPRRRRFSNPTGINFGVDALFNQSDAKHWMVTCHGCSHEWFMDLEPGPDHNHYIERQTARFICGNCHNEISRADRINGRWVAKHPEITTRRGYWISQLIAPWVTAERILDQEQEMSIETFHSMVLGKAYTPSDMIVNRETILRACVPSRIPRTDVVIGVDQNAANQIWVAMTPSGVFAYGKTNSWEEIEDMKRRYNAIVVSDPAPYPTWPKRMADKYDDWYLCYFKEQKGLNTLEFKDQIVYADRTRALDIVATEITEAKLLFRMRPQELEEYIADWQNLYRTTEEQPDGRTKSVWLKKDNKESDFSFATLYARIGLTKRLAATGGSLIEPDLTAPIIPTHEIRQDGSYDIDFTDPVEEALSQTEDY